MTAPDPNVPLYLSFDTMIDESKPLLVHAAWVKADMTMCGAIDNLDWLKVPTRPASCAECLKKIKQERQRRSREGNARFQARKREDVLAQKLTMRQYLESILEGHTLVEDSFTMAIHDILGSELDGRLVPADDAAARMYEIDLIAGMRDRAKKAQAQGDLTLEIMLLNAANKMNQILNDGERNDHDEPED